MIAAAPIRVPHQVIRVERDAQGVELALRGLFEESLVRHRMQTRLDDAERSGDLELQLQLEAEIPERDLSPGYYRRASYLLELSQTLEMGIPVDPATLTGDDVAGIRAVRVARAEYEREHPACPFCGERQDNPWVKACVGCHRKLRGEGD